MSKLQLSGIGMTSQRTRDRLIQRLRDQGIQDERVLDVMRATPRHWFLDEALSHRAYEDSSLPIGYQQTLSQPYIVARMTELLLDGAQPAKVLEVGAGSGYQTTILAQLVGKVYSVERIKPLLEKARQRLRKLGCRNVSLRHADGGFGWPERGPFDAILSAAAPETVPPELLAQLAPGGRLVIPIGGARQQQLCVYHCHPDAGEQRSDKDYQCEVIEPVLFVPLLGGVMS